MVEARGYASTDEGKAMYFQFGFGKVVEAVAVLLRQHPDCRMGRKRLLKLLYIADRESLNEIARPIIGTPTTAMDQGPLHSQVYNLIKGDQHPAEEMWAHFIKSTHPYVSLVADPGVAHLSRYDVQKLEEVSERYRGTSDAELTRISHEFPEWKKNHVPRSSKPIPMEDILDALGKAGKEGEIAEDIRRIALFSRVFGVPS
jgi:uncharacterized phage-associated protein